MSLYRQAGDNAGDTQTEQKVLFPRDCGFCLCAIQRRGCFVSLSSGASGKDLSNREAVELLENAGYRHENANQCVVELIRRLNDLKTEFPP